MSLMMSTARAPYRQDPGMGDPGIFGSLRKFGNFGIKTALGMTGFGGGAAAVSAAVGAAGGRRKPSVMPTVRGPQNGGQVMVPRPGVIGKIQRAIPGGFTGTMVSDGEGLGCGSKYRPNKSSYFLKDGTFVEKGTRCVRRRQRNPTNPRAMSRAIARIDAGKRFQNRMSQISTGQFTAAGKRRSSS